MPLGKLTDPEPTFLMIGRLKKGDKDEKGVPYDLDHWRAVFLPGVDRDRIAERFLGVYGSEPKDINIRLAFDSVIENWDANLECYKGKVLVAKAGQTREGEYFWIYYRDPESLKVLVRDRLPVGHNGNEFIQKPIDPTKPIYYAKRSKKPHGLEPVGRLKVVIPELATLDPPVVGFFEVNLRSTKDIRNVSAELKAIELKANQSGGKLSGIPMRLSRIEEQITKKIKDNLTRGASWMVHIAVSGEWGNRFLEYLEMKSLPGYEDIIEAETEEIPMIEADVKPKSDLVSAGGSADEQEKGIEPESTPKPAAKKSVEKKVAKKSAQKKQAKESQMVDPLKAKQVKYAAAHWNISPNDAAQNIAKMKLPNPIEWDDFVRAVEAG